MCKIISKLNHIALFIEFLLALNFLDSHSLISEFSLHYYKKNIFDLRHKGDLTLVTQAR